MHSIEDGARANIDPGTRNLRGLIAASVAAAAIAIAGCGDESRVGSESRRDGDGPGMAHGSSVQPDCERSVGISPSPREIKPEIASLLEMSEAEVPELDCIAQIDNMNLLVTRGDQPDITVDQFGSMLQGLASFVNEKDLIIKTLSGDPLKPKAIEFELENKSSDSFLVFAARGKFPDEKSNVFMPVDEPRIAVVGDLSENYTELDFRILFVSTAEAITDLLTETAAGSVDNALVARRSIATALISSIFDRYDYPAYVREVRRMASDPKRPDDDPPGIFSKEVYKRLRLAREADPKPQAGRGELVFQ